MTQHNEEKDRSAEQAKQAKNNTAADSKSPESAGFDKSLMDLIVLQFSAEVFICQIMSTRMKMKYLKMIPH